MGVAGLGADAARLPEANPANGFFGFDRQIGRDDIKDGLSTTLSVVETTWENGPWAAGGFPTVRGLDAARPYLGRDRQFGGTHAGRVMAAFADGSVRSLTDSMSPKTFEALSTIAGREEVADLDSLSRDVFRGSPQGRP